MNTDKIIRYVIPQKVKVRKYQVDTEKLKTILKTQKLKSGLSNKEVSERLNLPVTKVAHWFRSDKCFSVPDAEHWNKLKNILQVDTDEFDASILTFEEKIGIYDMSNRVYDSVGISPTITATTEINIIERSK